MVHGDDRELERTFISVIRLNGQGLKYSWTHLQSWHTLVSVRKITEHTYERANDTDKEREEKGDTDKYNDFGPVKFEDRPGVIQLKEKGNGCGN